MKDWFLKLKIRIKLILAFGSILLMSVLIIMTGISAIQKMISYNNLAGTISDTNLTALNMGKLVKEFSNKGFKQTEFLETSSSDLLAQYEKNYDSLLILQSAVNRHEFFNNKENQRLRDSLNKNLKKYHKQFENLQDLYQERGFKDYGVEGVLRQAIHDVEESAFPYDKVQMLMLRRHEKDFFLRKDLKYLERFNKTIDEFKTSIDTVTAEDDNQKGLVLQYIDKYKTNFNYITSLEQKIGLTSDSGLIGDINKTESKIQDLLDTLYGKVKSRSAEQVQQSLFLLFGLLIAQLIIGVILIHFYSKVLTQAIKEIRQAIVTLSEGEFPKRMITRTKDEISDTKTALNQLIDRIRSAVTFASNLGQGNLKTEYPEEYKEDVLAKAIINMQQQLVEADDQQSVINWNNEGMAQFGEILKDDSENLKKTSDDILNLMVKYLKINQGALYILDSQKEELIRISTYAYGKKKFETHKVMVGQGLIGQCVLEASTIHITEVPSDYIKITSGLGEATPTNLLIVPLKIREEVMGVIELASFVSFSKNEIAFVERVSQNIANILYNKQKAVETETLLKESQEKAEMLASQEEELRQNSEELQATQEDMERQRKEMQVEIEELHKELDKNRKIIDELKRLSKSGITDKQIIDTLMSN